MVFRPLRQLSELVRTRQVSPVALAETFLDRLRTLGPRYHAVVTLTPDRALAQARRAERELAAGHWRGPLHGIPYGIKDLFATAGIPTSWGAAPFRHQVFDYDATVVRRLERAGAVLAAKLAMVELAGGLGYRQPNASFTGPGINPWGEETWSGGSSSGSGSAVAAGLVPFAIGTETNGSIISPAANCGIAGLRPSYGRVSRRGGMPLAWSLDKPGPMALTADDCGLVLGGPLPASMPMTPPPPSVRSPTRPPLPDAASAWHCPTAPPTTPSRRCAATLLPPSKVLGEIADIEPVTLPDYPYQAVISAIMMSESASIFAEFARSGKSAQMTAPEDRYGIHARGATLAADYLRAQRIRRLLARDLDRLLARYDRHWWRRRDPPSRPALDESWSRHGQQPPPCGSGTRSTPGPRARPGTSRPRAARAVRSAPPATAPDCRRSASPPGFSETGLPTGIQFVGRAYEEPALLAVATAYQTLTLLARTPPGRPAFLINGGVAAFVRNGDSGLV